MARIRLDIIVRKGFPVDPKFGEDVDTSDILDAIEDLGYDCEVINEEIISSEEGSVNE